MRSFLLLCIVFLCLNTFTFGYLSLRDSSSPSTGILGNDWEHDFSLDVYDLDNSSRVLFPNLDNSSSCSSVGELFFHCVNASSLLQGDSSIPINIKLRVQKKFKIADVYIWVGIQGTSPSITDYTQWVDRASNAGGVTFVNTSLANHHSAFHRLIHLGDLAPILSSINNGSTTCFTVLVYVDVRRYCGFSSTMSHLANSPAGCDVSYQALYPSTKSYFNLAINHGPFVSEVNNETTYYEGYCLTPTRSVDPNYAYTGEFYSSYDPAVLSSTNNEFFENPSALPLINYIINHESEYKSTFLSGYQCTWQDIQFVIWDLLNPSAAASDPNFYQILTNSSSECRQWIYSDAVAHGQNFTPECPGGKYLMIIYPQLPGSGGNTCHRDNNSQIVAFPYGGSCLNRCQPKVCEDVLSARGTLCLRGKCGIPASPSSVPSTTSLPTLPSASQTSIPSASQTSIPSASQTSIPSASQTSVPSASQTSVPSASQTSVPSASQTSVPSASQTSVPSASQTSVPSASQTSVPSASQTSVASCSSVPSASQTSVPSASQTSVPSASQTSVPSASQTSVASCSSVPSASHTSIPSASQTSVPSASHTSVASASQTSVASCSSVPSASHTSVASASHTSVASASHTSVASASRSKVPSTTSLPTIPSQSGTPSHSSVASRSASSSMCHEERRSSSHSSAPSHSTAASRSASPSMCHEGSTHSRSASPSMCHEGSTHSRSASPSMCHEDRPSASHSTAPSHSHSSVASRSASPSMCHEGTAASRSRSASPSMCQHMEHSSPSASKSPCQNMGGGNEGGNHGGHGFGK